jgi:hypothetical protein
MAESFSARSRFLKFAVEFREVEQPDGSKYSLLVCCKEVSHVAPYRYNACCDARVACTIIQVLAIPSQGYFLYYSPETQERVK